MLDLYHADRNELVKLVLAQREALADRDRRVAELEAEVARQRAALAQVLARLGQALATPAPPDEDPPADGDGSAARGMPGLKPGGAPAGATRPRTPGARGFVRRRTTPTARVVHALACCPDCGAPLAGGTVKRTREVIEVPVAPAVVTAHAYLERRCPDCRRRCVPSAELEGVVCGRSRLGIGLVSLIAVLREEARLPFATVQQVLQALHGLDLSVGALVGALGQVARRAEPVVAGIRAAIRASPVVHVDETGWRENGANGYVWTFSTPTQRYFVRGTREKAVLEREVGSAFAGVLVSDFYCAYTNYDGRHQYCWAHLLRDIADLVTTHPRDAEVRGWADAVGNVFARGGAATGDAGMRRRVARALQAELAAICAPYLPAPAPGTAVPPQRGLCQRIEKHRADLFVFVEDPAVPPTNNAAERCLRHLVVSRKISGGTRSATGSTTKMTLASLFGTWRAQRRNPFDACRQLLAAPQA